MPIVFRFDSMDSCERATLVIDTPEAAARHITEGLNEGRRRGAGLWTLDEDGEQFPEFDDLIERLIGWGEVRLYDQDSTCGHMLTAEQACVLA
jgi:hypothetical protein